jgi:hypothetical protein
MQGGGRPHMVLARVSSWPPLRLTRLRGGRGSVGVVSPAAPFIMVTGGLYATRNRYRYPPDPRRDDDLG